MRSRVRAAMSGPHADWWASRMRDSARRAVATITISPHDQGQAVQLLGIDPETVYSIPNGVDIDHFIPHRPSPEQRRSHWLRWLVSEPRGWDEATSTPGSIRYTEAEVIDAFFDPETGAARPVLMYVGRFLEFKRVPLLVRAYARARKRMSVPAPLVIWGGWPGEWEGEHPHTVVTREHIAGVFFDGWRDHDELPLGLSSADCFVAPSTDEPFGLVYLEAMACGLPVIATLSGGPPSFINVAPGEPEVRSCHPTTKRRSPTRWSPPSTTRPNARGAAGAPIATLARATRGDTWPSGRRALRGPRTLRPPTAGLLLERLHHGRPRDGRVVHPGPRGTLRRRARAAINRRSDRRHEHTRATFAPPSGANLAAPRAIRLSGAAQESNLPTVGLPRPAGFEDSADSALGVPLRVVSDHPSDHRALSQLRRPPRIPDERAHIEGFPGRVPPRPRATVVA